MRASKLSIAFPVLVMAIGCGWLLTTKNIIPGVNWVWIIALGAIGVLALGSGINKFSVVVGPFLLIGSIASLLRQSGRLDVDTEIPILTIVLGALMLLARVTPIPWPKWMNESSSAADR